MRPDEISQHESLIEAFATATFDRQLTRFHDHFGRVPDGNDPVFFQLEGIEPRPMPPQEILALVTAYAWESRALDFESMESARLFAILVLLHLGLSPEEAEQARSEMGRFARH